MLRGMPAQSYGSNSDALRSGQRGPGRKPRTYQSHELDISSRIGARMSNCTHRFAWTGILILSALLSGSVLQALEGTEPGHSIDSD